MLNKFDLSSIFLLGLLVLPNGTDNTSGLVTCKDIVNIGGLTLHGQTFGLAKYIEGTFIRF